MYRDLLALVADVDQACLARSGQPAGAGGTALEQHGAIRVGTEQELSTLRRVFAVMGMQPVGYYDLASAGIPVHSTAFRPVGKVSLAANPFRVFTSLLRLEMIEDPSLRALAASLLARRRIFSDGLLALLDRWEAQGGFSDAEADRFVAEALETFRWHADSPVTAEEYARLHGAHRLVADIVCFRGPHINHLTPRTLDIDEAQREMGLRGMPAKAAIEGPPTRRCPILLRQTSFKALDEAVRFRGPGGGTVTGSHTARFGEIEQRGQALTPKGRALYDQLLAQARAKSCDGEGEALAQAFQAFPDDLDTLRREGLAHFSYRVTEPGRASLAALTGEPRLDEWLAAGWVQAMPITYEDFLPVSAAGIFRSNLGDDPAAQSHAADGADRLAFEQALGGQVLDEMALYAADEAESLQAVLAATQCHESRARHT